MREILLNDRQTNTRNLSRILDVITTSCDILRSKKFSIPEPNLGNVVHVCALLYVPIITYRSILRVSLIIRTRPFSHLSYTVSCACILQHQREERAEGDFKT